MDIGVAAPFDPDQQFDVDFGVLRAILKHEIADRFDHQHLNDFFEYPSAENLMTACWDLIAGDLGRKGIGTLVWMRLYETPNCWLTMGAQADAATDTDRDPSP